MVFEGPTLAVPPGDVEVREVTHPDREFLAWYRSARLALAQGLSGEVVDQLHRRDLEVFVPAGLRWFVGLVDGRPAGYTALLSVAGVGYLDGVVTLPAYRRRGVATATVLEAVRASRARGDRLVHLLADKGGRPRRLYERLGFRPWTEVVSFVRPLALPH
jgi:GNAT superfamily N-acetyltransferase